jgi:hypothetical protein
VRVALSIWRRLASSVNTGVLDIYEKSSIDLALKDAFRKMRAFLMKTKGLTEDEAISLISIAVDFGVTHGRRQLGHPRHHQEEPLHRRNGLRQVNAPDNQTGANDPPAEGLASTCNTVGIRVLEVRCRARRQPT